MVPISKIRFHDGVSAAEHTGKAWYVYDYGDGELAAREADGWYPIVASGRLQPWDDYIGEGDVTRQIRAHNSWLSSLYAVETRTNPDGTVTTLGLFTTKKTAEAYIKNPKEFQ